MRKIALWEAKHPKLVLTIALLLLIPAMLGFVMTRVNYDILSYLPDDLESVQGEAILDKTFNNAGMSIVIVEESDPKATAALKQKIEQVDGVATVIWVDSLADISIPADILPDMIRDVFYSTDGSKTMMLVQYKPSDSPDDAIFAIENIKTILTENTFISGLTAIVQDTKELADKQAPIYIAIAVCLALAVMAVMMESWIQPLIIVAALGIAVLYNMGTNVFLGSISFITQCIAAVLQLGVTMDYSIFLIERYKEEKLNYGNREEAMASAVVKSFSALAGSSLTTVFGFLALCLMKLKLGFDIGFVMAKGVVFGVLTVIFILPSILMLTEKVMQKYTHRSFIPNFDRLNSFVLRHRRGFVILFIILLVPAYLVQGRVQSYYSMDKALPDYLMSIDGLHHLKEDFNMASTQFVIIDDSLPTESIMRMEDEIEALDGISSLLAYNSFVGPAVPDDIIPDNILALCKQGGLQLFMVNSEYSPATPEMTRQLEQMNSIVKSYDPNGLVTGEGAVTQGLMDTTDVDFAVTSVISITAIFILIAICLKSISLPVILVLSIELAIWINLSISVAMGTVVSFVDPTVLNCIQLGATVDYAILLTTRFKEELYEKPRLDAMKSAAAVAERSVFQSAAVFFAATFGVYITCDITIVKGMCALLARGAIISELVIMLFLSPVLCSAEGIISKTTKEWPQKCHRLSTEGGSSN